MKKELNELMNKKLKDVTFREVISALISEKSVIYTDITTDCIFEPHCTGGSNDSRYGVDATYYALGISYNGKLIFKLNANDFQEVRPPNDYIDDGEKYTFHWQENGSFMIVKKTAC